MFEARQQLENRIMRLKDHARTITDDAIQAEIARYLCILASTLIQERCKECAARFAADRAAPEVARFVRSQMRRLPSPTSRNIRDFFGNFDKDRANGWFEALDDDQRAAIDSIAANRNLLAHGVSLGLSLGQLTAYEDRAKGAMHKLDLEFG